MNYRLLFLLFTLIIPLLVKAQKVDTIRIYFDSWEYRLTASHKQQLKPFARLASQNPAVKLMVFGYADPVGSPEKNQHLSEQRAQSVARFLTSAGVKPSQIVHVSGKGERPNSDRFTEEKHVAEDRRVEVLIRHPTNGAESLLNLTEGETLVLKGLTFLPGRHLLRPEAYAELEKLSLILRQNPGMEIEIRGHICCEVLDDGTDLSTGQQNLSYARAKFVFDWLVEKGVNPKRMRYIGLGSREPLVRPERNEEDRNQNRRVEIRLLKK